MNCDHLIWIIRNYKKFLNEVKRTDLVRDLEQSELIRKVSKECVLDVATHELIETFVFGL